MRVFALTISWDPTIRGYLVVATGVAVLCGSVYLLLATNTGIRLGFLIAAAGLAGWMTIMGLVWWLYGIGWVGEEASWHVREVVVSEEPEDTSGAATEDARDLSDWEDLPEGGGDATAGPSCPAVCFLSVVKHRRAQSRWHTAPTWSLLRCVTNPARFNCQIAG